MSFRMGLIVGGLVVAVVALAAVVVVLATGGSDGSSSPASSTTGASDASTGDSGEDCGVVESGGPARLDVARSGLDCEAARTIQLSLVNQAKAGAEGTIEVGEWLCTREPFAEYPILTRCVSSSGHELDVVGTAPAAHLTPAEQKAAEPNHSTPPSKPRPVAFQTPSGNIVCVISRHAVACEIFRKTFTPYIPKPPSCPLDYGHRVSVGAYGPSEFDCYGDSMSGIADGTTLHYRREIRRGRIGCLSEKVGLTCETVSGTGFFLSVQAVKLL